MKIASSSSLLPLLVGVLLAGSALAINVGDEVPSDVSLHFGFPPQEIPLKNRLAGKKVLLM
jgi:hypothetical protein